VQGVKGYAMLTKLLAIAVSTVAAVMQVNCLQIGLSLLLDAIQLPEISNERSI